MHCNMSVSHSAGEGLGLEYAAKMGWICYKQPSLISFYGLWCPFSNLLFFGWQVLSSSSGTYKTQNWTTGQDFEEDNTRRNESQFKDSLPKPSYITIVTCAVLIQSLYSSDYRERGVFKHAEIVLAKAWARLLFCMPRQKRGYLKVCNVAVEVLSF